jgi:hypothetical protein
MAIDFRCHQWTCYAVRALGQFIRAKSMTRTFEYKLFADYHRFYLQDESVEGNLRDSWTPEAVARDLAVAPGAIGIARCQPVRRGNQAIA